MSSAASGAGAAQPRILAMGGGGFTMSEGSDALDRFVLALASSAKLPRICFLPTASGDRREQVTRFYERFGEWPCEPSILSLFHLARSRIDPIRHLLAQDAIYVGGGSMRNMLAIWHEHGIDQAMRSAWRRGVLLAGLSAGAMCWFEGGISMSGGSPEPVRGLGLLRGSMSVHLDSERERLASFRAAVALDELPGGHAADDGAALLYVGGELRECVASREGAGVLAISSDGAGGLRERQLPVRLLPGARAHDQLASERQAISELRALRAGRRRWD